MSLLFNLALVAAVVVVGTIVLFLVGGGAALIFGLMRGHRRRHLLPRARGEAPLSVAMDGKVTRGKPSRAVWVGLVGMTVGLLGAGCLVSGVIWLAMRVLSGMPHD